MSSKMCKVGTKVRIVLPSDIRYGQVGTIVSIDDELTDTPGYWLLMKDDNKECYRPTTAVRRVIKKTNKPKKRGCYPNGTKVSPTSTIDSRYGEVGEVVGCSDYDSRDTIYWIKFGDDDYASREAYQICKVDAKAHGVNHSPTPKPAPTPPVSYDLIQGVELMLDLCDAFRNSKKTLRAIRRELKSRGTK